MALQYVGPATKYWYAPTSVTTPGSLVSGVATITAWFRLASGYSGNASVAGWGNGSTTYNGISAYSGNVAIQERNSAGGSGTQTIVANPTDLAWHFAAFQSSATNIYGGLDGTRPTSGASGSQIVSGASQFNRVFFGGGGGIGFLNGSSTAMQVAEIAVWDNALSSADVAFLYNGGTSGAGGSPKSASITSANLLAYFRLISDFTDLGPNIYTVSNVGAPTATWVAGPTVDAPPGGGTNVTVAPGVGSAILTGYAPTVTVTTSSTATPGAGSLGIAGTESAVSVGVAADTGVGSVAFAGHAPSIASGASFAPGLGALAFAGAAPDVNTGGNVTVSVGLGSAVLTGAAPTVTTTTGGSVTVEPGLGRLSIAGHAPAVTQPAEEPRTGGAADRRKKKKRKPAAKVLTSLSDLSEVTAVYEPRVESPAPVNAPLFSDLLRSLDAQRPAPAPVDRSAETHLIAAKEAERRAAIEATRIARERERVETAARQKDAAARLEAQNKRVAAMRQSFDALVKRHRDQEEEDLEWLLKG